PPPATNHVLRFRKGERFAAHHHEISWDQINVIQGTCHFFLNGEEVVVGPGHSVMVPPMVTHEMYNPYDEDVVSVDIQIPPDPHIYERACAARARVRGVQGTSRAGVWVPQSPTYLYLDGIQTIHPDRRHSWHTNN